MPFPKPLVLEYVDGFWWGVRQSFIYLRKGKTQPRVILVPRGFTTDFASTPRVLWRLLPPTGTYGKAAVIHDYLYATGSHPRKVADRVFLDAMQELGVSFPVRYAMYAAVRLLGGPAWRRARSR